MKEWEKYGVLASWAFLLRHLAINLNEAETLLIKCEGDEFDTAKFFVYTVYRN